MSAWLNWVGNKLQKKLETHNKKLCHMENHMVMESGWVQQTNQ